MLESLKLINLQAHKKLEVQFDPFVTTIVGPSDIGKSAILRALKWIALNNFSTKDLLKWGTSKTLVRLIVDGHTITRKRTNGTNSYSLDGHTFKAFGASVPEAISSLLRLQEINFQEQLDSPFWFKESPGQVSRQLNSIVNLGVIDQTFSNVSAERRKAKSTYDIVSERLRDSKSDLKELNWVRRCNKELTDLESQSKQLESKRSKTQDLQSLLQQLNSLQAQQESVKNTLARGRTAVITGRRVVKLKQSADSLHAIIKEVESATSIAELKIPKLNVFHKLGFINQQKQELQAHLELIEEQQSTKDKLVKEQNSLLEQLKQYEKGKCPVCQRPM